MNQEVTLLAAFAAGFLSFVSPCVLPLIPGYISFVSGISVDEMRVNVTPTTSRLQVFLTSLAFVIGFAVVFVRSAPRRRRSASSSSRGCRCSARSRE
jgi:cytochrome c-type biogenesis protein